MPRKKQGYNARKDESMTAKKGRKSSKKSKQSLKSRRDESAGMEKKLKRRKYASVGTMDKKRKTKRKMNTYFSKMSSARKKGLKENLIKRLHLNENKLDEVPTQMRRWNKAGGKVLPGLERRRLAESLLFEGKEWHEV